MRIKHQLIFKRMNILVMGIATMIIPSIHGAPTTAGSVLPMPNKFWPNQTTTLSAGTVGSQKSPYSNPDVFCSLHNGLYRLPSIGEMQGVYHYVNPWYNRGGVSPFHWSQHLNNDITQPVKTSLSGTANNNVGYLMNEWGNVNLYGKGWDKTRYWVTEPYYITGIGRLNLTSEGVSLDGNTNNATIEYGVACVRDLIPTPSTPVVNPTEIVSEGDS